jgi:hypothetical protein
MPLLLEPIINGFLISLYAAVYTLKARSILEKIEAKG